MEIRNVKGIDHAIRVTSERLVIIGDLAIALLVAFVEAMDFTSNDKS